MAKDTPYDQNAPRMSGKDIFNSLCDCAPDIICTLDRTGSFTYVNPAWEKILGHTPEEVLNRNFVDFVRPEDRPRFKSLYSQIREEKKNLIDIDGILTAKNGKNIHFAVSGAPRFGPDGRLAGMVTQLHDITGRIETEQELKRQKAYAEELLESAPEGIAILDPDDTVIRINKEFTRIFGYAQQEAVGRKINELIVPDSLTGEGRELSQRAMAGGRFDYETRRVNKNGEEVDVSIIANPVWMDGELIGIYGVYRNISERKKAEEDLKSSEKHYRTVLEAAPDPVMVCDSEHRTTYVNPAFTRVFGWSREECCSEEQISFIPPQHEKSHLEMIQKLRERKSFSGMETKRYTKNGIMVDVSISGAVFEDKKNNPEGCILTLQDITERKMKEEELRYVAYYDQLTNLPNRKSFYMFLERMMNKPLRRSSSESWGVMLLDLDRFKEVNDILGHEIGDRLIKAVSRRLAGCIGKSDELFRLGGDEFTIITKNLEAVNQLAGAIHWKLTEPFKIMEHEIHSSASIGISVFPQDGRDAETLVKNADMAMYSAKETKSGYSFFTADMNRTARERMQMEKDLKTALDKDQIILHYQPIVNSRGEVKGAEALVRWQHPELGLIPPSKFISLAEETGDIVDIGKWVLQTACTRAVKWHKAGRTDFYVSVNLSPRQFREENLVDLVRTVIRETGLDPRCLKLEITETSVMVDPEECIRKISLLNETGIDFSIDDFGTGYSSLSYLKRFPITTLKIDRSFIMDSMSNRNDREIIKSIVKMAKSLDIDTVAEGIETVEQQSLLTELGCRSMQGFYFGRPVPDTQFEKTFFPAEQPAD
ncbi:MAG: PAS domain S-box protein [Thermodesulfobacteriota bacterium]